MSLSLSGPHPQPGDNSSRLNELIYEWYIESSWHIEGRGKNWLFFFLKGK